MVHRLIPIMCCRSTENKMALVSEIRKLGVVMKPLLAFFSIKICKFLLMCVIGILTDSLLTGA